MEIDPAKSVQVLKFKRWKSIPQKVFKYGNLKDRNRFRKTCQNYQKKSG